MNDQEEEVVAGRPLRAYDKNGLFRNFSTDEFVGKKLNYFKGWACGAGVTNLQIRMDGQVFAATCGVGGELGNIYGDFEIPDQWITCPMLTCSCGADLFVPKADSVSSLTLLKKTHGQPSDLRKQRKEIETVSALERMHASTLKQVYWEIGRRCNYDCSYCVPAVHNNFDKHVTIEQLIQSTEKLDRKFMQGSKVNFIISGGEPTVNPALIDWLKYLHTFGHHISVHSNGSRLPDYYRELVKYCDLNLSVHFEFWKKDRFLKVVEAVVEEKKTGPQHGHLEVKIMMAPGRRAEALSLEESLRKIPGFVAFCTWAIVPVRGGERLEEVRSDYQSEDFALFGDRV